LGGRGERTIFRRSVKAALFSVALLCPLCLLAEPNSPQEIAEEEIEFRILSRADFLATQPPPEAAGHLAGLNAVSCLRIGWRGLSIDLSVPGGSSEGRVSATVASPRFVALFDRKCSWWHPQPEDPAYALMHEQVHFAIAEYAARTLTQEMRTKKRVIRGNGPSRDAALANLNQSLEHFASRAKWAARREHDAFDAATRRDRSSKVQQEWVHLYEERLSIKFSVLSR
jgi:hypothetical protein